MGLDNLLKDLETFVSSIVKKEDKGRVVKTVALNESQKNILKEKFEGWQAPIKGTYYNSGAFGIGDARHKGKHDGVDLRASGGTTVYPIGVGFVESVRSTPKGGYSISILHDKNVRAYYAHLGTIKVKPNDFVDNNTAIATVGNSGNAKGTMPHIHLETRINGSLVNPSIFFDVPAYTNFDRTKEVAWLSDKDKQIANNFNLSNHLDATAEVVNKLLKKYS